jgi:hypothetical protein
VYRVCRIYLAFVVVVKPRSSIAKNQKNLFFCSLLNRLQAEHFHLCDQSFYVSSMCVSLPPSSAAFLFPLLSKMLASYYYLHL